MRIAMNLIVLVAVALMAQGCLGMAAGAATGATVGVTGAAVGVTAKGVGAVGRAIIPGDSQDKDKR